MDLNKYLEKAEVLVEALPYIQRFNRKIIVVKYGGSAMLDESLMNHVIEDVVLLKLCGFKPVVVHGSGTGQTRRQGHRIRGHREARGYENHLRPVG